MARRQVDLVGQLERLLAGEMEVRDFPWLDEDERRDFGAKALAMLQAGQGEAAMGAFAVLIDLEPDVAVHYLMYGHAASLMDQNADAFQSLTCAIQLAADDPENADVAAEAFLARGDLLLRLGRTVEARADLADASSRMDDPVRRKALETFLAT
jgi:tetratricopeptide (TPR) repeat protein